MVTIIRDRIQDMVKRGLTLAQVKAANPTMEYDGLYGNAPGWTKDQFVEAVYNNLKPAAPASRRAAASGPMRPATPSTIANTGNGAMSMSA